MTTRPSRRWPWLLVAALLFAAAAWLMSGTEAVKTNKAQKVSLPKFMTHEERNRNIERQTIPVAPGAPKQFGTPLQLDPVLTALPSQVKRGAVVIEANAIRHSDLGNLMVECLFTGQGDTLAKLQDAGFNPLESLDRIAVADESLMITGDFSKTDVAGLMAATEKKQFGPNAELLVRQPPDGGAPWRMGLWKGQMLVLGETESDITAVLDRLEGKGERGAKRLLTDADAYGEVYGVLKPAAIAEGVEESDPALALLLRDAASSIRLHADVSHDVGVVAQIEGSDPARTQDLRKALGTALTLARLQAEAKGNKNAAEVLGFARVAQAKGDSANFQLEAGVPYEFLQKQLQKCVEEQQRRKAGK